MNDQEIRVKVSPLRAALAHREAELAAAQAENAAKDARIDDLEALLSISETRLALFEAEAHSNLQTALAEIGRLTEVLRDIAGTGDPDSPSYSQAVARSALTQASKGVPDYWSVAVISAWLRDQDGHGEWHEAADAIDAEFIARAALTEPSDG